MVDQKQENQLPDWAIHISEVYKWAEETRRRFGGRLTKRTIQWYTTSGLLPDPERIGKEAYYNKHTIFNYLRIIEILNRKHGLLLSEVRQIIRKVDAIEEFVVDADKDGSPIYEDPINALYNLLEGFLDYAENEAAQCGETVDGPDFTPEQMDRLVLMERELVKRLKGDKKTLEKLLTVGILGLEAELFPKGKVKAQPMSQEVTQEDSGSVEVPF